jgi:hypothetical protein
VEGRVVYEDTGKPAAGAQVTVWPAYSGRENEGTADARGQFSVNCYQTQTVRMRVAAAGQDPYLSITRQVSWPKGAVRIKVDFAVPRGVRLRGHVVDQTSGKPIAGAALSFLPLQSNNPARPKGLADFTYTGTSGTDGAFTTDVPVGRGHLLCNSPQLGLVTQAVSSEALLSGNTGGKRRYFHGILALDLKAQKEEKEVKLSLRRGVTLRGKLVGPDGKPVNKAVLFGPGDLLAPPMEPITLGLRPTVGPGPRALVVRDGQFELPNCDPDQTYRVFIRDWPDLPDAAPAVATRDNMVLTILFSEIRRRATVPTEVVLPMLLGKGKNPLAASVDISAKKAGGKPMTVQLAPCGSAVVRFVDAAGKPAKPNLALEMEVTPKGAGKNGLPAEAFVVRLFQQSLRLRGANTLPTPDAAGRLTLSALIPGVTYRVQVFGRRVGEVLATKEFTVPAGKTVTIPDQVVKGPQ